MKAAAPRVQVWEVRVSQITCRYRPLNQWGVGRVTMADVQLAVKKKHFDFRPHDSLTEDCPKRLLRRYHIERTACLIVHRDDTPIEIDVGCPVLNYAHEEDLIVTDGHHRLAAAMIRGDETIRVTYGGQTSEFRRLFPGARSCG